MLVVGGPVREMSRALSGITAVAEIVLADGWSAIVGCIGAPAWHRIKLAYFWGAIPFKWRSPQAAVVEVPSEVQVWLEYRTGPTSWSTSILEMR